MVSHPSSSKLLRSHQCFCSSLAENIISLFASYPRCKIEVSLQIGLHLTSSIIFVVHHGILSH